jgi:hypothetical protein
VTTRKVLAISVAAVLIAVSAGYVIGRQSHSRSQSSCVREYMLTRFGPDENADWQLREARRACASSPPPVFP